LTCNVRRKTGRRTGDEDAEEDEMSSPSTLRNALDDIEWLRERLNKNLARQEEAEKGKLPKPGDAYARLPATEDRRLAFSDDSQFIKINFNGDDEDAAVKRVELTGAGVNDGAIDVECAPFEGQKLHHWREYPAVFTLGEDKGVV
jgi:hypothetical protein